MVRGGRFLWASEGSDSTLLHILCPTPSKKACNIPSTTVSHLPPQQPTGVTPEVSNPAARIAEQASPAASSASEEALPHWHETPLHSIGGIKRVYRCQVEGCKEGLSTSCATICAKCTWGWGWCVPLVANHSSTWTHSEATRKVTSNCKYHL